jgi:hypothetical protein
MASNNEIAALPADLERYSRLQVSACIILGNLSIILGNLL